MSIFAELIFANGHFWFISWKKFSRIWPQFAKISFLKVLQITCLLLIRSESGIFFLKFFFFASPFTARDTRHVSWCVHYLKCNFQLFLFNFRTGDNDFRIRYMILIQNSLIRLRLGHYWLANVRKQCLVIQLAKLF